jgi:type IV pilus assembly protein PilA
MNKLKNKKWFTIVELVVVVMVIAILSTIWFISYTSTLSDARNSTRISDMWNLKMWLKNHKLQNWSYPIPGNAFDITNSWTIIKQWLFNNDVYTQQIVKKPIDPLVKWQYYFYSITSNKLFFQIAMSLEENDINDYDMRAYLDWDYQQIWDFAPTILFASTSSWTINSFSGKFIVDKGTLNLPYDENWNIVNTATSFSWIIEETWINVSKFYWYYSCQEIYENWNSMWIWTYKMLNNEWKLISNSCDMNY